MVVPDVIPVSRPPVPMVATEVALLLQVPPVVPSVKVVVLSAHTPVPEIVAGKGFTVTILVALQPVPRV